MRISPSIQLRQRMRDAKETGSQAEIGLEMADALKQTIERFGGGEIVTLEDAARDPSKANLFKIQEDLLGQYGISGESAANTLDMLKELSSVTLSGNEELKNSLGEQLAEQLDKQDENTLYQDRIANSSENIFASSVLTNKYLDKLVDLSLGAGKMIAGGQSSAMRTTFNMGDMMVKGTESLVQSFRHDAKKQLDILTKKSLAVKGGRFEEIGSVSNVDLQNRIIDITKQSMSNATYNITASFQNGTFRSSSSSVNSHADPVPLPPLKP